VDQQWSKACHILKIIAIAMAPNHSWQTQTQQELLRAKENRRFERWAAEQV